MTGLTDTVKLLLVIGDYFDEDRPIKRFTRNGFQCPSVFLFLIKKVHVGIIQTETQGQAWEEFMTIVLADSHI